MLDVLSLWIEVVKHNVRVATVRGCKNDHFEILAEVFDYFLGVRADVDACFDDLASRESNGQLNIKRRYQCVVAVDEGLIEIEDDCLAAYIVVYLP